MTYTNTTHKGKYHPKHPEKYRGDLANIVFRSSYERIFFVWCDKNPKVLEWSSEEIVIPYRHPGDGEMHRYFVDAWMKTQSTDGIAKRWLVEIKPDRYQVAPVIPKRKTKQFLAEVLQWQVNECKWKAARAYAKIRGWEFVLVGEKDLGINTIPLEPLHHKRSK